MLTIRSSGTLLCSRVRSKRSPRTGSTDPAHEQLHCTLDLTPRLWHSMPLCGRGLAGRERQIHRRQQLTLGGGREVAGRDQIIQEHVQLVLDGKRRRAVRCDRRLKWICLCAQRRCDAAISSQGEAASNECSSAALTPSPNA
jgi:hypothetical protein